MRTATLTLLAVSTALTLAVAAPAAEGPLNPGLKPGKDNLPGPFHPYNINGDPKRQNTYHCLVSEYGLDPVVLVFVRGTEPSKEVLDLLGKLDALVAKNQDVRLHAFAVFLTADVMDLPREDNKREAIVLPLRDATAKLKQVVVALDTLADVKDLYKLNDEAEVTVVLYSKYKVLAAQAFRKDELKDEKLSQGVLDEIGAQLKQVRAQH